jgi:hypothetical protein
MSWPQPPPPPPPPRWEPPHQEASRALMSGFAGCLGVGLAILAVVFVLAFLVAISSHH